jgi:hypothetical protein
VSAKTTGISVLNEEARERKIALFWTLVQSFERRSPISQEEIISTLKIDDLRAAGTAPRKKLAYVGAADAVRQKFERDKAAIRDMGFEISTTSTRMAAKDTGSIQRRFMFPPST